jgi:hypothetical protein
MSTKLNSIYLYTIICLLIAGCRGCSCNPPHTNILESIVEEIKLDSNNTARIKIEHLEKVGMGFTFEYKSHGSKAKHVIRYNLKLNDRPYRNEIFEHDAVATDSMNQHRKDISIQLSPDELHLLLKYEGEIIGVYHLLDSGMPFTTTIYSSEVKAIAKQFKQNSLQSPEEIMLNYVAQVKKMKDSYNNKYVLKSLQAQSSPYYFDKKFLELLGLPLVDGYFEPSRVKKLCTSRDTEWRTRATKKVYRYISEARNAKKPVSPEKLLRAGGAMNIFLNGLNDYMDSRAIERQVLPQYPLYPYTVELFHDTEEHRTLRKKEAQNVSKNCVKLLTEDQFRESLPSEKQAVNCAIEFLIRYRDERNLESFEKSIAAIFRKEILDLDPRNMEDEILFPYDTRFSESEQEVILRYAKSLGKEVSDLEKHFHLNQFLKEIEAKENPDTGEGEST